MSNCVSARAKNVVVVGGGTGNFATLSGLKNLGCNLAAVVAMTDSGGSSGGLREELGHLPPGNIRRCLIALSTDDFQDDVMRRLFDFRFSSGDGLNGHSFGDLLLSALTEITGNTITAIDTVSHMLGVKGTVLPVTLTRATLIARLEDGTELVGEAAIDLRRDNLDVGIDYVRLHPKAYVYPPVLEAIENADAIVLGPGDMYSNILPNLIVDDVAEAINRSKGIKIYVCNLMTKPGESDGFKASNFLKLVLEYLESTGPLDYMVFNDSPFPKKILQRYSGDGQYPVKLDWEACQKLVKNIVCRPLLATGVYLRHDSQSSARTIMEVLTTKTPETRVGS